MIDFNQPSTQEPVTPFKPCECTVTEIRQLITRNGRVQMKHQCLTCGKSVGTALPITALQMRPQDYPEWDKELSKAYWERVEADLQAASDAKNRRFWNWYDQYLLSPEWRRRRELVMSRAGGICEACGSASADQVHHTTYEHVGDEALWELRAVCAPCHDRLHSYKKPWEVAP